MRSMIRSSLASVSLAAFTYALALGQAPFDGITLITQGGSLTTSAVDLDGNVLMTWEGAAPAASFAYLLPDGSLLRPCRAPGGSGGGAGGRIQRFDANGTIAWDYVFSNGNDRLHHDLSVMPNGNILLIAWDVRTQSEAIDAGRIDITGEMWPDAIIEIEPVGTDSANIVWEWRMWDHLVQDVDDMKANYGVVADHPELIDINHGTVNGGDWTHVNSIDYDPQRDQIVFSSRSFGEFYVIDHSTTTAEAAGHTGGRANMGGDILYRWGNPAVYQRGTAQDQYFFVIHGVNWIDCGMPGGGNILAFNNGDRAGSANDYSTVVEVSPPYTADGTYDIEDETAFGPLAPNWTHGEPGDFYGGPVQCGAFRLPNGNTLICLNSTAYIFEVSSAGELVWEHDAPGTVTRAPRYWMSDPQPLVGCLGRPDIDAAGCEVGDLNCDGSVDLLDYARLQRRAGSLVGP